MSKPRVDIQVTGQLAEDPSLVERPNADPLVTLRLIENPRVFDNQAQKWVDADPISYSVAMNNNQQGQNVLKSLSKGNRVTVAGSYDAQAYNTKDGALAVGHRIWADRVDVSLQFATVEITKNPPKVQVDRLAGVNPAEAAAGTDAGFSGPGVG